MKAFECNLCGYVYDPETGDPDDNIPGGTAFEDLPEEWFCPHCGQDKNTFHEYTGKPNLG